jgi:hypothetical protein
MCTVTNLSNLTSEKSENALQLCILAFLTASGAKLLNVPQLFENFGPTGCQIVGSFSTFEDLGSNWGKIVESTASIRQFCPLCLAFLLI